MRGVFREWYAPTTDELTRLWDKGLIVLDASAMLGLYRMAQSAADVALELLDWLKDRVWVPYQAGLEFHQNRLGVIRKQADAYGAVRDELGKFERTLNQHVARHTLLNSTQFLTEVARKMTELTAMVNEFEAQHPWPHPGQLSSVDPVQERLLSLLDSKIGRKLSVTDEMRAEAKRRLEARIPPGYKDRSTAVDGVVGDMVLWWELLAHIRENEAASQGILFVTEDLKEDWWWMEGPERIGPRPELAREALDHGAGLFWMQSLGAFARSGSTHLGWQPGALALAETPALSDEGSDENGPEM